MNGHKVSQSVDVGKFAGSAPGLVQYCNEQFIFDGLTSVILEFVGRQE